MRLQAKSKNHSKSAYVRSSVDASVVERVNISSMYFTVRTVRYRV